MGSVIPIGGISRLDLPVETVLDAAKGELEGVLLMGFSHSGEFYVASTYADGGDIMWLMEAAKRKMFACIDCMEEG